MAPQEGDKVCLKCGGVNAHNQGCDGSDDQVFEVISSYSRAQAIEDGVLVDCSQAPLDQLNRAAGIKVHVAMTVEAFHAYVHPVGGSRFPLQVAQWKVESDQLPPGQSMVGRYWDIIWILRLAMLGKDDASCVFFQLRIVPNEGGVPRLARLKCVAGSDDDGNVCLTIMLPDQD